ncbi:uncharacterized protein LOC129805225 [Phlebotomus papatasi]|uniref:uncharacterized protein LOC129805225 n=1 Tax=Phlebotomus papatasi TaxID=29031 RepID=UPI002484472A|nr:uncharacterized protein LOC129805225 [Phlebotomus papatasi]
MPEKELSRRAYKGQLTSIKKVLEKFQNDPTLLERDNAEMQIVSHRDMVGRVEQKFQLIQMEIIKDTTTPEDKEREQKELMSFLDDCMVTEMAFTKLLATISSQSPRSLADDSICLEGAGPGSSGLETLLNLMSKQLKEQRQQRLSDESRLKEILDVQREEFSKMLETRRELNTSLSETDLLFTESSAKLEPIKIPSFGGSYCDWQSFKNLFLSSVDKNPRLTKSQKMQYLVSNTNGEALALFSKLPFSDENYDIAWNRLVKRYDDKMLIVAAHMDAFLSQQVISKPNASALRKLQSSTNQALEAINALQVTERDPWLIHWTLNHVDHQTRTLWSEKKPQSTPTWADFDDFLNTRCRNMESCPPQQSSMPLSILDNPTPSDTGTNPCPSTSTSLNCAGKSRGVRSHVLFATAVVKLLGNNNTQEYCRIILDPGSQINIISTFMCEKLQLPLTRTNFIVDGVGSISQVSQQETQVRLQIKDKSEIQTHILDCLVMMKVIGEQPNWEIDVSRIQIPPQFQLADPLWFKRQKVDLLIGGSHAWQFLGLEKHVLGEGLPMLQHSVFGWLVVGPCYSTDYTVVGSCNITTLTSIDRTLKRFWEIEDVPKEFGAQSEHEEVEAHFQDTTFQDPEGRYVVSLPLRDDVKGLDNNRVAAVRQLNYLNRRLVKNPSLLNQYDGIFKEYLSLNIIEKVPFDELQKPSYYFPHHGVIKNDSSTTKIRIVFNASSRTKSGRSLNDCMMACPVVQPTLVSILWRFRLHEVVLTCDIVKMYLQVLMNPSHRDYHRFVWFENSEMVDYRFRTVCFGVAASPYLATRVLNQIATDNKTEFPLACSILTQNFYVDDCLFSAPTIGEAIDAKNQLENVLGGAGMKLSKFRTNRLEVLQPEDDITPNSTELVLDEEAKTLGILWNPKTDAFHFRVTNQPSGENPTKRYILSTIARIFDPCGLIGPIVTIAKIILQDVWETEADWDTPIPNVLEKRWQMFVADLADIEQIQITRWISTISNPSHRELHAFCDASKTAYGVSIYLVCEDTHTSRSSSLLVSKSRLMPIPSKKGATPTKITLTIPKAELSGAELATQVMNAVSKSLGIERCFFWTDAMVILHQIHSPNRPREVFVRHRVSKILSLSTASQWRHVPTSHNPADVLSRGSRVKALASNKLWWSGPEWLLKTEENWPQEFCPGKPNLCCSETLAGMGLSTTVDPDMIVYDRLLEHHGSFLRISRVLAWIFRAVAIFKSMRIRRTRNSVMIFPENLQVTELEEAEVRILKWDQKRHLKNVRDLVKANRLNSLPSPMRKLRPFMDPQGILRVGGRLSLSSEDFDLRHPIILPKGKLSDLLALREHQRLLHAGPQLTLASLRRRYWPLNGRNTVKRIIHSCVKCIRLKPPKSQQLMGDLPPSRVSFTRPFRYTGIDFTGHIMIKRAPRGGVQEKSYVAVFVCMTVKAVHLELITSLTTHAFIAAFKRFVARRGLPAHIYSDNGTNLVGGEKELRRLLRNRQAQQELSDFASKLHVQWHFNTPGAPHQGGLWEAAVKSFKYHLSRIVGNVSLTYEELNTVIIQIEAVLNSRPLVALTDDPQDPTSLTPGDFLTGGALTQLPVVQQDLERTDRLHRWELCTKLQHDFMTRWKRDYLHTLQQRHCWNRDSPNIEPGDVVLVKSDIAPNLDWPMGLVEKVFPGKDNRVRVAQVRDYLQK